MSEESSEIVGFQSREALDRAIADLRECTDTQGGVLRALRVLADEVHRLDAVNEQMRRRIVGLEGNTVAMMDSHGWL